MIHKGFKLSQYTAGMSSALPVIFGFIPVGIAYAIMAREAGMSIAETITMSAAVFAGASQMMAVGMYIKGASIFAMILATFILNLRHLIMSTCVMDRLRAEKPAIKLLAGFGVTDETFAIFTTQNKNRSDMSYFLGIITVSYLSWVAGSAIGALCSALLPAIVSVSFGIALYAMFIGLLMPNLRGNFRLFILVILTAAVNTVLSRFIASSWSMIISTLICAAAGVFFTDIGEDKADEN